MLHVDLERYNSGSSRLLVTRVRSKTLKVAIGTMGRFHVLDLARELSAFGHEVDFYSFVPRKMALRFGLPKRCHRGVLPVLAPLVAWGRFAPTFQSRLREQATAYALNAAVIARMRPCDVFICMSGMYLEAAAYARERFGAQVWLERGSRHILSQNEILKRVGAAGASSFMTDRELKGYDLAAIMRAGGWSNAETVSRYLRFSQHNIWK